MSSAVPSFTVARIDDATFEGLARGDHHPVPIEQAPVWDAFDARVPGREPWGRVAIQDAAGEPRAVASLTRYEGRGFVYLWAKHGPVWRGEPSAADELAARRALVAFVAAEDPQIVFVRWHAQHPAPDLRELLQTITYDRTVLVDLAQGEEGILAGMNKRTRKKLRQVERDEHLTVTDETDISREGFAELYAIHQETAQRGEFGIFGMDVYWGMLESLRPHARLFVARRSDAGTEEHPAEPGRAIAWVMSTSYDGGGVNYYSGANAEARRCNAPLLLRWHAMRTFAAEGVRQYDFMGVDSERAPSLAGVGEFKRQFGPEAAVVGAWDVPVRAGRYRMLGLLLRAKRLLRR